MIDEEFGGEVMMKQELFYLPKFTEGKSTFIVTPYMSLHEINLAKSM
jgi:hypothetical protein